MTNSKKQHLINKWLVGLSLVTCPSFLWAGASQGIDLTITKSLIGAPGSVEQTGGSYALSSAMGEQFSGNIVVSADYLLISGYIGGRYGNGKTFTMVSAQVGSQSGKTFFQDGFQVGVPLDAAITIDFSEQLLATNLPLGIYVFMATDHLGNVQNTPVPFQYSYDPSGKRLIITPSSGWQGNTFYDVILTPQLLSIDQFSLDAETHVQFLTILDPHQDNVVLHPLLSAVASGSSQGAGSSGILNVHIPAEALADFSAILFSRDPVNNPLQVNPSIVQEATTKAAAAGGPYRTPLAIQEIAAYNAQGERMVTMTKPADIFISYESQKVAGAPTPIRAKTLSLWTLDETHKLWVKLPGSVNTSDAQTVSAPVTRLSVFALMGAPSNSASDAFVFPVPWRPHGPNAGTSSGQTGTEAGGMTFSNLPSECTIRIYTIAGELVREIRHSDTTGLLAQEIWDGKTTNGDTVASGVYLWRVESSTDGKNGKLMIIR